MTLGLALGSGGARGFCHIGVLRGMEQAGYAPDMVAGCSMGALVGAAWAAGQLDALENWARDLTKARFLS
ncbi:MAG: patatin-like phospholipase family protein [Marinibacterium sp.]|nr:patatin-like phospholipase family protein [Marinibacterium sp.]